MDQDGLPIVGTGIDYTKVKPIDKKRLLAFVNHFVSHTAQFLNKFADVCEDKMIQMEDQLQRLEITMNILEAKLSSIQGLENITVETASAQVNDQPQTANSSAPSAAPAAPVAPAGPTPAPPVEPTPEPEPEKTGPKVSEDPRYVKYFKMVNMGVPPMAVQQKMLAEGLDPGLLDTPDAPAPSGRARSSNSESDSDSNSSDDEFSD